MKRFYALLLLLCLSFAAQSQVLFTEGFESAVPPTGWTLINSGPSPNNWVQISSAALIQNGITQGAQSGSNIAGLIYDSTYAANGWLIAPGEALTAGTSYTLSFWYSVAESAYPEKMKVTVGNAATVAAQTTVLWNNNGGTNLTNTTWALATVTYVPATTGMYYFGFNCYSDANEYVMMLDNTSLVVTGTSTALLGDSICSAPELFVNGASMCANTVNATTGYEDTAGTYSCSVPNNTIWYKYTPAADGPVGVRMSGVGGATPLNGWVAFFTVSGTCPTLTPVQVGGCLQTDLTAGDSVEVYSPCLTAGTTYYILVDGVSGATGDYCISLFSPSQPPPTCAPILQPMNGDTGVVAPDVTFTWGAVPNATGYQFLIGTSLPLITLGEIPDTTVTLTNLPFGTTFYWSIVPVINGLPACGCGIDSFRTMTPPAPPANDSCGSPRALYNNVVDSGTVISATESMAAEVCAGFTAPSANDVWYTVTATANGDLTVTLDAMGSFDGVLQAYTGTCGSFTNIGCADAGLNGDQEVLSLTGLTAGTTYYVRVYGWNDGSFMLTANGTAFPVSLTAFKGVRDGAANLLSWTTATEQNNRGFELQRSADGANFTTLAFVETKGRNGNSTATLNYAYTDEKPFAGNSYYRLKQIDKDGRATSSNVVLIKGDRVSSIVISAVYPNPAKDKVSVVLTAPSFGKATVIITDLTGKVVLRQPVQLVTGDNNLSVSISHLPAGTYMVKAVCSNSCETAVNKLVKE